MDLDFDGATPVVTFEFHNVYAGIYTQSCLSFSMLETHTLPACTIVLSCFCSWFRLSPCPCPQLWRPKSTLIMTRGQSILTIHISRRDPPTQPAQNWLLTVVSGKKCENEMRKSLSCCRKQRYASTPPCLWTARFSNQFNGTNLTKMSCDARMKNWQPPKNAKRRA